MSISTRAWSFPVPGRCCKALSRAGRGLLFSEKSSKRILAKLVVTCRRRGVFCKGVVSTARRGGVPFTRVCRRGLRSMSGHPAYAWGNPPTLRRSSFPQRASRPAGGPIPKHAWGCAPRPPTRRSPPARKAKRRLPGAGLDDAYKVPQAHFYVEIVDRVPLPRCGEGGRGKGQMLPQATFGAHLCAVRICFSRLLREKQHS